MFQSLALSGPYGPHSAALGEEYAMNGTATTLGELLADIPRVLFRVRERSASGFLSTGVTYPNGVGVTVRVDRSHHNLVVSDDGYAAQIAETMGVIGTLNRIAGSFAKRYGVTYEKGTFFIADASPDNLAVAVSTVANTSARAMERVVASLEQARLGKSRALFDRRLETAFGNKVKFDIEFKGATGRSWGFDAGVLEGDLFVRLYELVSPSTQAVALANMKISDTQAILLPPHVTAALTDYEGTEPALRAILSYAGSTVIPASAEVESYKLNGVQ